MISYSHSPYFKEFSIQLEYIHFLKTIQIKVKFEYQVLSRYMVYERVCGWKDILHIFYDFDAHDLKTWSSESHAHE